MSDSVTSGKNKEIINQIKTLLTDPDFAQNKKDAIKNTDKTLLRILNIIRKQNNKCCNLLPVD